ncbi:hypothetical protein KP509_02G038100 [Ceratopteris richardii]|uniref:Terpene synthase n=1 Tax=Ceratopteris richardii TaxID=49495 RepID=A0A8T2VD12_CERRI|nr:hypothetical protein KP509_02G038100 [Ceratopteris richardii]
MRERMPPIVKMMDTTVPSLCWNNKLYCGAEVCQDMPANQKARLSQAFCVYLEGSRVQVPYRNSRQLPDLQTYLQFREDSIGWDPFAIIIEHSQGFELDDESSSHPMLLELHKNAKYHIILSNDIMSFKKEDMQGDFCNVLALLYFQKLYYPKRNPDDRAPILQGAILDAIEMVRERNQNCVTLMEQTRKCNELISKPCIDKYLEGVGWWISGNLYWHLASARFGICATSNIHENAPNMHVDHQLKIDVNKGAAETVPKEVMTSI